MDLSTSLKMRPVVCVFILVSMFLSECTGKPADVKHHGAKRTKLGVLEQLVREFKLLRQYESECIDPEDEFKCNSGQCVSIDYRCNELPDCADGEDEEGCENYCPSYQEKCEDGIGCYDSDWLCDGSAQCADGSDENGCFESESPESPDESPESPDESPESPDESPESPDESPEFSFESECIEPEDEFQCASGLCVPIDTRCDESPDCADGEDEEGCEDYCPANQEKCPDGNGCFDYDWLCDGTADCTDGSDEDEKMCAEMYSKRKFEQLVRYFKRSPIYK